MAQNLWIKLTSKLCSKSKLADQLDDFEPSLWGLFLSNFSSLVGTESLGGDRGESLV